MTPWVTVLMPVFNAERHLQQALDSVLAQSLGSFELIVVEDGSSDRTAEILAGERDPRLRVIRNPRNLGLTRTLNRGLEAARGEFIARQDADDASLARRLETQVARFERDPDLAIVGSASRLMNARGRIWGTQRAPLEDLEIRWTSLLENPFIHTSVMLRKRVLDENGMRYDESFPVSQDFDLWTRLLEHGRGANVREALVLHRIHAGRVTSGAAQSQGERSTAIAQRTLARELPAFDIERATVAALVELLLRGPGSRSGRERARLAEAYLDLLEAFAARHRNQPGMKGVRRRAALRAAALVLSPPLCRGCGGPLVRALRAHPGLPAGLLRSLPEAISRRFRRMLAGS